MGLFCRKEKTAEFGPAELEVETVVSADKEAITVGCTVKAGRIRRGERLTYRPNYGQPVTVTAERIEAMMMQLEQAMEGTFVTLTLSGSFEWIVVSVGDKIVR